MKINVISCAVL